MGRKWSDKVDNKSSPDGKRMYSAKGFDRSWKANGNTTQETFHTSNSLPWQSAQLVSCIETVKKYTGFRLLRCCNN